MRIKKKVQGAYVDLDISWIKDYPRYGLYQVYKIEKGKFIPIYKECYTRLQIKNIIKNKCVIEEEVFV